MIESTTTRIAKKAITPKLKNVTTLSSVRPQSPTPSAAIATGASASSATSDVATSRARRPARLTGRTLSSPAYVDPRGDPARDRAGADRVPADLLVRPPDPRPLASGLHLPA